MGVLVLVRGRMDDSEIGHYAMAARLPWEMYYDGHQDTGRMLRENMMGQPLMWPDHGVSLEAEALPLDTYWRMRESSQEGGSSCWAVQGQSLQRCPSGSSLLAILANFRENAIADPSSQHRGNIENTIEDVEPSAIYVQF